MIAIDVETRQFTLRVRYWHTPVCFGWFARDGAESVPAILIRTLTDMLVMQKNPVIVGAFKVDTHLTGDYVRKLASLCCHAIGYRTKSGPKPNAPQLKVIMDSEVALVGTHDYCSLFD